MCKRKNTTVTKEGLFRKITHSFSCPLFLWRGSRGNSPSKTRNTSGSTAISSYTVVLLAPRQDGTKQGRRCSHSTWSFGLFRPFSSVVSKNHCLAFFKTCLYTLS